MAQDLTEPDALGADPTVASPVYGPFLRRARQAGAGVLPRQVRGELSVDLDSYEVLVGGERRELSPRQVEILALFVAEPHRVWSREQLDEVCWGNGSLSRRVDVQLCRIRNRLGLDLFRNIRDRGWALREEQLQVPGEA